VGGTTLSMLAFGMMNVVQGVVAFDLTGKNGSVGFVYLGQGIMMLILGPLGGTLSDRISKKKLLTGTQIIIGISYALIGALIALDAITILILAGASLVLGCMFALMGPTRNAWVGDLLHGPEMANGVALQQLVMNGTRIVGPLVAGVLIGVSAVGTAGTYFTMAGLFAGVVSVLALMDATPPRKRAVATSVRADITEGFKYIWRTRDVRLLALIFFGVVLSAFSYQTLMPGYLENALGHPAKQLGLVFTVVAAGGIAATLGFAVRRPARPVAAMLGCGVVLAASLVGMALAPNFGVALLAACVMGAGSSGFQVLNNVALMERSDPAYFGRVMSLTMMAFGLNSVCAYPIGSIADAVGERGTLAGTAALCMVVVGAGALAMRTMPARRPDARVVEAPAAGGGR
jgi:MFS family permease